MGKGILIVLDGLDGAGKSTQVEMLGERTCEAEADVPRGAIDAVRVLSVPARCEPAGKARGRDDRIDDADAVALSRCLWPVLSERAHVIDARRGHVGGVRVQSLGRRRERAQRAPHAADARRLGLPVVVSDLRG